MSNSGLYWYNSTIFLRDYWEHCGPQTLSYKKRLFHVSESGGDKTGKGSYRLHSDDLKIRSGELRVENLGRQVGIIIPQVKGPGRQSFFFLE